MADKKISDLPALTTADATDVIPVVDISASVTKKVTVAGLAAAVAANVPDGSLPYAKGDGKIWWEEIGRAALTVSGDTITVSGIPARKYLQVIVAIGNSGALNMGMQFNGDTGGNYAFRRSINGAADVTATSASFIGVEQGTYGVMAVYNIVNIANREKQLTGIISGANAVGAANLPSRQEISAKWSNTSASISSVTVYNVDVGDFTIGSEVVVLGHN